jgi:hypothetical protein
VSPLLTDRKKSKSSLPLRLYKSPSFQWSLVNGAAAALAQRSPPAPATPLHGVCHRESELVQQEQRGDEFVGAASARVHVGKSNAWLFCLIVTDLLKFLLHLPSELNLIARVVASWFHREFPWSLSRTLVALCWLSISNPILLYAGTTVRDRLTV